MSATLTLLRHPRPCVAAGICYGRTDCAAGADHEQALLAELLDVLPPQRVLTSPAVRCRVLATLLCDRWQRHCEIEPRLQEMDFGRWEGLSWDAVPRTELDGWARQPVDYAPGGGESLRDMAARVRAWAGEVAAAQTDVLAVTHGGVMRLLIAWSQGEPLTSVLNIPAPGFGQILRLPFECFAAPRPPYPHG